MDINNLPQLSDEFANDSAKFVNAVLAMCSQSVHQVHQDVQQWYIFINFYRLFVSWFVPVLIVFGEVGTLLCLIVLLRRRTGNAETRMWFVALSIADMYSLGIGLSILYASRAQFIYPWIINRDNSNRFDLRHYNIFSCYVLNGMVYFGLLVSTWIQVGISILRVISVKCKNPTTNKSQTHKYSIALTVCIFVCLIVTFLLIGFSMDYTFPKPCPLHKLCILKASHYNSFFYISLVIKVLLPTIFLLACSLLIINHLKKFKRRFSGRNNNDTTGSHTYSINYAVRKRVKQKQISYTLLGMNLTFFVLTLPFEVYKIYFFYNIPQIREPNMAVIRTIDKFLNILLYTSNATNWLFYFMLGQRFRQSVIALMCQKPSFDCGSIVTTFRRFNTSLRSYRRTKSTPVPATAARRGMAVKASPTPEEIVTLVPSQPKFHCTYPAVQKTFPKFY